MAFEGATPASALSKGDWTMAAGRKSKELDQVNEQFHVNEVAKREADQMRAESEKKIAEEKAKAISKQAGQAAGE